MKGRLAMIALLRRLWGIAPQAELERLDRLAVEMDELLSAGKITPQLRRKLQKAREELEQRIRRLLAAQSVRPRGPHSVTAGR
jgi:hypothetical protein